MSISAIESEFILLELDSTVSTSNNNISFTSFDALWAALGSKYNYLRICVVFSSVFSAAVTVEEDMSFIKYGRSEQRNAIKSVFSTNTAFKAVG